MAIEVTILPEIGIVYVRFSGQIAPAEAMTAFKAYFSHTDARPDQNHIIDLSKVTGFSNDYVTLFEFLSQMDADSSTVKSPPLFVHIANTPVSKSMAQLALNAFSVSPNIIARVAESEREALDILGLPHANIDQVIHENTAAAVAVKPA